MKFSVRIYADTINSDILFDTMERFIGIINYKINKPKLTAMIKPGVIQIQEPSVDFDSDDDRMDSIYAEIWAEISCSSEDRNEVFNTYKLWIDKQLSIINEALSNELVTNTIPKDSNVMCRDGRWFVEVSPGQRELSLDYVPLAFSSDYSDDIIRDTVEEIVDTMIYDK